MTTSATETLQAAVARRLRGQLAERMISQKRLSELTGWSAMYISRRYTGETPLDVKDLEAIEAVTGISPAVLLTGPSLPSLLPWVGSNHQPSGLRSAHLMTCPKALPDR